VEKEEVFNKERVVKILKEPVSKVVIHLFQEQVFHKQLMAVVEVAHTVEIQVERLVQVAVAVEIRFLE
jgi:hypothetical protein